MMLPIVRATVVVALTAIVSACAAGTRSTGEVIDDTTVTARVKAGLVRDPSTKALQIHVDTHKGQVLLSGYVDSPEAKAQAESVARAVPGATSVLNELVVK